MRESLYARGTYIDSGGSCSATSKSFWTIVTDALPAQDVAELSESLGIEVDSLEHVKLESGALCSSSLKRKR